jgi:hypothetical protein
MPNPHVRKAITPYTLGEGRANKQKTHHGGDNFAPEDRPKISPNGSSVSTSLRRSPLAAAVSSLCLFYLAIASRPYFSFEYMRRTLDT